MFEVEGLVGELSPIYRLAARAVVLAEVSALNHKAWDHAVERRVAIMQRFLCCFSYSFLAGAEHQEVLRGFWCLAVVEREGDAPLGPAADADVHPARRARHRFLACYLAAVLRTV